MIYRILNILFDRSEVFDDNPLFRWIIILNIIKQYKIKL